MKNFVPWIAFTVGVSGGVHCVGMCGGLMMASSESARDTMNYQLGRLLGYLSLGLFAGLAGHYLNLNSRHPLLGILPTLLIGGLFIFLGLNKLRGKSAELPMPKFMGKTYYRAWNMTVYKNKGISKSFFTGLISIMLPCGLIYGVMLGMIALQSTEMALLSMIFFWLGTLPSMVMAPTLIYKLINPLKHKAPRLIAVSLIILGVATISFRLVHSYRYNLSDYITGDSESNTCH